MNLKICQARLAKGQLWGLGRQLKCTSGGGEKVLLVLARGTFSKNEVSVALGIRLDMHLFVASLLKRVLMSCWLLDVRIISLNFVVFYFSLFFICFSSVSSFAVGV